MIYIDKLYYVGCTRGAACLVEWVKGIGIVENGYVEKSRVTGNWMIYYKKYF